MENIVIAGCGYLGRHLAHRHLSRGDQVLALVRRAESQAALQSEGIDTVRIDLDSDTGPAMPDCSSSLLYWLAPPPRSGVSDSRSSRFIELIHGQTPRRVVLVSTTGVYGDCSGDWVDETRQPNPKVPRALRRCSAERQWRDWADGSSGSLVILRLAGFYGPGRLPLARLRKGLPMLREQESPYSNRIHRDDLIEVCLAAMEKGEAGEVYNVSDGHPSTMLDYFNRVADLAGLERPPQIGRKQAEDRLSEGMIGYLNESRRIDNHKMLTELKVKLRYPTLAEGLPACLPLEREG